MATIKSYTDIPQSETLNKILPLESADMFHFIHEVDTVGFEYKKEAAEFYSKTEFEYLPCWSLVALLSVLPLPDLIQDKADDQLFWYCCVYNENGTLLCETNDNNPVDACYEMIMRLHELKLNLL